MPTLWRRNQFFVPFNATLTERAMRCLGQDFHKDLSARKFHSKWVSSPNLTQASVLHYESYIFKIMLLLFPQHVHLHSAGGASRRFLSTAGRKRRPRRKGAVAWPRGRAGVWFVPGLVRPAALFDSKALSFKYPGSLPWRILLCPPANSFCIFSNFT